jgi:uncharacterized protein YbjT (DUF2867 family)
VTDSPILVVGATGTLGARLDGCGKRGDRLGFFMRADQGAGLDARSGELADLAPETLKPAFRGVERVFVIGKPTLDMEAMERNAIGAAVDAGARRIVYLSNFTAKVGSELLPNHVHGVHEQLVASLGLDWTVLGPTRYMTSVPFNWRSVLNDGLLLEAGGSGVMTCIDPADVASVAVKVLTEDGHAGQIYRLTSEDAFTAADLARLLSSVAGREVRVFDGDAGGASMGKYFAMVAAGLYKTTDTAGKLLGRRPRTYSDWLLDNLPAALRAID